MLRGFRSVLLRALVVWVPAVSPVLAATPEDGALEAAQAWARAIMAHDVDAQMKLLPATMYPKPGEREFQRLRRVHDKELAVINKQNYVSFDVRAPAQTLKVNTTTAVVLPYRSVLTIAEGKLQTDSALVALSAEGSNHWSVFDGTGHSARSLKSLIPGYTTGLNVPRAVTRLIAAGADFTQP